MEGGRDLRQIFGLAAESEVPRDDLSLPRRQLCDRPVDELRLLLVERRQRRVRRCHVLDERLERRSVGLRGLVERNEHGHDLASLANRVDAQSRRRRKLGLRGMGAQPVGQLRLGTVERPAALDDLLREADEPRLLRQCVADRAPDLKARIAVEARSATDVVVLQRVEQAERALLDEVVVGQTEIAIAGSDRAYLGEMVDDELLTAATFPQVGLGSLGQPNSSPSTLVRALAGVIGNPVQRVATNYVCATAGCVATTRVPAAPSTSSAMSPSAPITASRPLRSTNLHAASTFGPIEPAANVWARSSAGVAQLITVAPAVPKPCSTYGTSVASTSRSAWSCSARSAALRSLSMTASTPLRPVSVSTTGIPPPPAQMT